MPDQGLNLTDKLRRAFNLLKKDKTDTYIQVGNVTDFGTQVVRGLIPGFSSFHSVGFNPNVGTSVEEVMTNFGGVLNLPTTASTLSIVSSDANDTSAGTGARTITIIGLDANKDEQTVVVTMNGLTPVVTTETFTRTNDSRVTTAGTSNSNEGTITITHGVITMAQISPLRSVAENAIFTVPNGRNGYLMRFHAEIIRSGGAAGTKEGFIRLNKKLDSGLELQVQPTTLRSDGKSSFDFVSLFPEKFVEKTDVFITLEALTNNTAFTGGFEVAVEDPLI